MVLNLSIPTYLGHEGEGFSIAVDEEGNAYVAGKAYRHPTVNALQLRPGGARDCFVTKLSADGARIIFSTYLGGSGEDSCYLALDPWGDVVIGGRTGSIDFPVKNAIQRDHRGGTKPFIAKMSSDGSELFFSTFWGGSESDWVRRVDVDRLGNIYAIGGTTSLDFPTKNALLTPTEPIPNLYSLNFALKIASDGSEVLYSTLLGEVLPDGTVPFVNFDVDEEGFAYFVGVLPFGDFPVIGPPWQRNTLTKMTPDGSSIVYFAEIPGISEVQWGKRLTLDGIGNVFITSASEEQRGADTIQPWRSRCREFVCRNFTVHRVRADNPEIFESTVVGTFRGGLPIAADDAGDAYIATIVSGRDIDIFSGYQRSVQALR